MIDRAAGCALDAVVASAGGDVGIADAHAGELVDGIALEAVPAGEIHGQGGVADHIGVGSTVAAHQHVVDADGTGANRDRVGIAGDVVAKVLGADAGAHVAANQVSIANAGDLSVLDTHGFGIEAAHQGFVVVVADQQRLGSHFGKGITHHGDAVVSVAGALEAIGAGVGLELGHQIGIAVGLGVGIHPEGDHPIAIGVEVDVLEANSYCLGIGLGSQGAGGAGLGIGFDADRTTVAAGEVEQAGGIAAQQRIEGSLVLNCDGVGIGDRLGDVVVAEAEGLIHRIGGGIG